MLRTEYSSLRQGLVGAWCPSLGASGYTLLDRSGRNNHGTLILPSSGSWSASGSGLSVSFDGTTQYATLPFAAVFGSSATLSMWIQRQSATPSTDSTSGFFSANLNDAGQASHYPYANGLAYFRLLRSSRVSFTPISTVVRTAWHHVTVRTDGSTYDVYQSGVLAYSTAAEATASLQSPLIVAKADSQQYYCSAKFDDIRLYNRALTLAEIRLLASRRGIGLSPLPDRAAGLPRKAWVNIGGVWKNADTYINTPAGWKLSIPSVNVGGVWR